MKHLVILAGLTLLALSAASRPAVADPPVTFSLPIGCAYGKDCWIPNYVDQDPGEDYRDYACGHHSYQAHKGTDFAIRDLEVMARGVEVRAAAAGVVSGTRDGMPDVNFEDIGGAGAVKGRECGNGVGIDHGNGWMTQYCHMRRGSVRVAKGQEVKTGDLLGFVGNSGLAEFPHLHFQVAYTPKGEDKARVVDPFLGLAGPGKAPCGPGAEPLWRKDALAALEYHETDIYNAGFGYRGPKAEEVRKGMFQDKEISNLSPALVLWADIFGIKEGDRITMVIKAPDGSVFSTYNATADKRSARKYLFAGKKRKDGPWASGTYTGEIQVSRKLPDNKMRLHVRRESVTVK